MSPAVKTLVILAVVSILFITEIIPLAATAMMGSIACGLVGVLPLGQVFSGFSNSTVVLFAAMFVVGANLFYTGLAQKIGNTIVGMCGKGEVRLMVGIMLAATCLSSVLSNTGSCASLMPVVLAICATSKIPAGRQLMPLAFACSMGGGITMVGAPPNIIANQALSAAGFQPFGFFEFGLAGIPIALVAIVYMVFIGRHLLPKSELSADQEIEQEIDATSQSKTKQLVSGAILLIVVFGMALTDLPATSSLSLRGLVTLEMIAFVGAIACVLTKCMTEKQAYISIDWVTILLFAGMLPISTAMDKTGAGKLISGFVVDWMGGSPGPYLLTACLFALSCGLTQFMSNTAAAALLAPIGVAIAQQLGASPQAVVMAITVAASCALATPVGTPPNTLVLGPGKYRFLDYTKAGTPLIFINLLMALILIPSIWPFFPGK